MKRKAKVSFRFEEMTPEIHEQLELLKEAIKEGDEAYWKTGDAIVELRKRFFHVHKRKLKNPVVLLMLEKQVKFKTRQRVGQIGDTATDIPRHLRDYSIDPKVYEAARVANNKLKEKKHDAAQLVKLIKKYPDAEQIREVLLKGTEFEKPIIHNFNVTTKAKEIVEEGWSKEGTATVRFDGSVELPETKDTTWASMAVEAASASLAAAVRFLIQRARQMSEKFAEKDSTMNVEAKFWDILIRNVRTVRRELHGRADFAGMRRDNSDDWSDHTAFLNMLMSWGAHGKDWDGGIYQKKTFIETMDRLRELGLDVSDFSGVQLTEAEVAQLRQQDDASNAMHEKLAAMTTAAVVKEELPATPTQNVQLREAVAV